MSISGNSPRSRWKLLILNLLTGVLGLFPAAARAQNLTNPQPIAVLKTDAGPVFGMAFSNDGSRLVTAGDKGIVWDVARQRQICVLPAAEENTSVPVLSRPILKTLEATSPTPRVMTYRPLLSPDGKVAAIGSLSSTRRLSTFQAWNAETGKEIGPPMAAPPLGSFTAAELSPDGRFLALAANERAPGTDDSLTAVSLKPSGVGAVSVWDLKAGKLKWQMPPTMHEGDPAIYDDNVVSLSFSPDATRLAVSCGSSKTCVLKVLVLEDGVATPTVVRPDRKARTPSHAEGLWGPGGRFLIFRNGLEFEFWDPTALTRRREFALALPQPPPGAPTGFQNSQSVLSRSGGRLALLRQRVLKETELRQLRVVAFDVLDRKPIGFLVLPDERYGPVEISRAEVIHEAISLGGAPAAPLAEDTVCPVQLALSGDGSRLAVGDEQGVVKVYDVVQIMENTQRRMQQRRRGRVE